jgi:hypothetical protein
MSRSEPIVPVKLGDPTQKPMLFACSKCGRVHSWKIYACQEAEAIKTAREAAADCYDCREHNICQHCGEKCEKNWTACDSCRHKNRLAACEKVAAESIEECFAFDGDEFFSSPEDALDAGVTLVQPAELRHFGIDVDRLIETILDDHHEDASQDDLNGLDELIAAVEKFNEAQTSGSYDQVTGKVADLASIINDRQQQKAD